MATPQEIGRAIGDVSSLGVLGATLTQVLPAVAALFTIGWTALRIYESKTVQAWLKRRRKR